MPAKNKPFFRQFTTSSFSFLPSTMSIVTLRYVKMINGINPPFSKKRRVKTFLQRVTDYRRGEKRRSFSSPEEEKRNETKFIYKDEFDPLSIIQPFRLEKLPERSLKEEVVRKREHHLLACLKFISQKGIPITYFFRVRRFSMINY